MFPLKDDILSQHFPVVNLWLIIVNVLCFVYQLSLGSKLEAFIVAHGFVPARFAAEYAGNAMSLGSYVPIFSAMFLHGGLLHVFSNLWMLWIFGNNVEDRMGHGRYLLFYLLCGVAAAFAQFWANPQAQSPMIGASGAISGVLGAYVFLFPRARILTFIPIFILFYLVEIPAYFFIGVWFLLQFMQGAAQQAAAGRLVEGGVAWWAHVGGFVAGVMLLYFFKRDGKKTGQVWL
ncbi:MAG: rhomboid family intramembrane serine protease [Deltaproteobacteria bacterium]|nr:rhomboid family intramembrane serine protease [Deltaproteobacteria bacterium]